MTSSPLAVGDRVRIRSMSATSDLYGRVASMRDQAAAVECLDRNGTLPQLPPGEVVEVSAFGPTELRMFPATVLADKGGIVVISVPLVARVVRSRGGYRKPCRIPAACLLADNCGETFEGWVEDISLGGLLLALERKVEVGARLVARFTLPGSDHEVEVTVEVVRIVVEERADEASRFGCAFTNVNRTSAGRLTRFIEEVEEEPGETPLRKALAS
jgi:c-di-GMP-binding flagellar brake protein YcgR